ncbi:LysR family transcriptional regulator [Demequina maris]|uniref:LysR family transcriptional regulator n=1 Tax=Demequina maris TaxID=1638982 RepID=UPI0007850937|nr:LysR family transcriptional regulator [Demequina maris]
MVARLESIDLNLLVALNALLEERHVTNAGARLHIGQSAMSGILRRLRGYFGDELLVRVGNELQLTPFAESLRPAARAAYDAASELFSGGVEFDPLASERVFSICVSDYSLSRLGPPLMEILRDEAPHVGVSFEPTPTTFIRDPDGALLQCDVLVLPVVYLPAYASASMPLFDDDFVVVTSSAHPFAQRAELTMEDLQGSPQLHAELGPRSQLRPLAGVDAHLALGTTGPHASVHSYLAMPHLLRRSAHWALMPRSLAASACDSEDFAVAETPFESETFTEHAFWHPSRQRDTGLAWLKGILGRVAASEASRTEA